MKNNLQYNGTINSEVCMKRILFVCHGNICRSPMAEMIFKHLININGVEDQFFVDSAGTSDEESRYHSPIHKGTKNVLTKNNIPFTQHIARQFTLQDYKDFDYIICMEQYNITNLLRVVSDNDKKISRLLDFTNTPKDVDDPWYHRDFDKTYEEIYFGCQRLFEFLINE